jgi:tetratricopeptide (TPR) repeat protein
MKLISAFFSLFLISFGFAQESTLQFEQANQSYRNGDYQTAIQMFEQVIKNGYSSPALYYNLGNSYFKIQNVPAAILNFERAKRIDPNDDDINYNLRLANLRVIDKIEPIPRLFFISWWQSFINLFSSEGWAIAGIIGLWLAAISAASIFVLRRSVLQRTAFLISIFVFLISILAFVGMYQRIHYEQNESTGIIFSATVSVKSAPDSQSTDLFVLHEGVKVEFLDAVGEWKKIRLADGKVGWLSSKDIQTI